MVLFYKAVLRDKKVSPWLTKAMLHHTTYGSDGFYQSFGVAAASRHSGVKQGWGNACSSTTGGTVINSTGFTANKRFAIAILSNTNRYGGCTCHASAQVTVVDHMAKLILPGGGVNLPATHNPKVSITAVRNVDGTTTLTGWAFDPDKPNSKQKVTVYDGSHRIRSLRTTSISTVINKRYGLRGRHAFTISLQSSAGPHTYSVRIANVGYGTAKKATAKRTFRVAIAPPTLSSLSANSGPAAGQGTLTVHGAHFVDVTGVAFGTTMAQPRVVSGKTLTVTVPPHAPGAVQVRVRTTHGLSAALTYTYLAPTPPSSSSTAPQP